MFDGSIKPPRVVRLSGPSCVSESTEFGKDVSVFKSGFSVKVRAAKKIKSYLQFKLIQKKEVKALEQFLPAFIKEARLCLSNNSIMYKTPLDLWVSLHPICRLMRLLNALAKYEVTDCLSQARYECIQITLKWYENGAVKHSFVYFSTDEKLKRQFTLLIVRFINSFFHSDTKRKIESNFLPGSIKFDNISLSPEDINFCNFLRIVSKTFPKMILLKLAKECGLLSNWYPRLLLRCFTSTKNQSDLEILFQLFENMEPFYDSHEDAFYSLVNFWAYPNLFAHEISQNALLGIIKCTIHERLLIGSCGMGYVLNKSECDSRNEIVTDKLSDGTAKSETLINNLANYLLPFLREKVTLMPTLDSSKMLDIVKASVKNDSGENRLNILNSTIKGHDIIVYVQLFDNLLLLIRKLFNLNMLTRKDLCLPLESIFNVLLLCFSHFEAAERPDLYKLQKDNSFWTKLLRFANLNRNLILIITQLLAPSYGRSRSIYHWEYRIIEKVRGKLEINNYKGLETDSFELDDNVANVLLTCSVPSVMLDLFKQHFNTCCGSNFLTLYTHLDCEESNRSIMSELWKIYSSLILHSLKIMYDNEIIKIDEDKRALMRVDDAIWLSKAFNHMYWYKMNAKKVSKDIKLEFKRSEWYPHSYVCNCGIEIKLPENFATEVPYSNGNDCCENYGILARKFNGRFYRLANTKADMWLIPEAEQAIITLLDKNKTECALMNILDYIPHTLSFKTRILVFYKYISDSKERLRNHFHDLLNPSIYIIRRKYIVEDGLSTLGALNNHQLKQVFKVLFVDENGIQEQGVDGGGLFKEFLITLCSLIFDPKYGIFEESPDDHAYIPSPNSGLIHENHLQLFCFIGKIVGKALYEQILIEPVLSRPILNLILKQRNTLDDLRLFDHTLYRSITCLRNMSAEEIDSLELSFTATRTCFGNSIQEDIVPDGKSIKVTKDNVESFIHHFSNYKCNKLIELQCSAFLHGLSSIIPLEWLRMFSPAELELLISGSSEDVNVEDMRSHTVYAGGFTQDSDTIVWFWEIMLEYDKAMRSKFLWFVTCSKRTPLMGFKQLQPPFCIHKEPDSRKMPTVSTCLNLLKLAEYPTKAILKSKLYDAMSMSKGFGLH